MPTAKVSLFLYDNDTFIVESFLDEPVTFKVVTPKENTKIQDMVTNKKLSADPKSEVPAGRMRFAMPEQGNKYTITLQPHTYQVFKLDK